MNLETFAAERKERLVVADEVLEGYVVDALERLAAGDPDWSEDLVAASSRIWYENFQAEAPGSSGVAGRRRFEVDASEALSNTTDTGFEVDQAQVDRITRWLSDYSVNSGTTTGAFQRGIRFKLWVSMADDDVRSSHAVANGQVVPIGSTFDVGGARLAYPGDPTAPLDEIMNCRCVVMPASREGETMSANTFVLGPDQVPAEEENPDIVLGEKAAVVTASADSEEPVGDDAEWDALPAEIPVRGVAAPEGVETGDGRMFGLGSLSNRELGEFTMPISFQTMTGEGGHVNSVTVGRIDQMEKVDLDGTPVMDYTGVLLKNRPYAREAYFGIKDASGRGVSVDIDMATVTPVDTEGMSDDELMEMFFMGTGVTEFSEARIAGLTIVSIPAFEPKYAHIALAVDELVACGCDYYAEYEAFRDYDQAERDKMAEDGRALPDGSFPIADEEDLRNAIQSIGRAGDPDAAKAHIKKRAAALDAVDLIPEDWSTIRAAALFTLVAAGGTAYPAEFFRRPDFGAVVPMTITKDRHFYGYLAAWRTCHIGIQGICTEAPPTMSDYSYFLKGKTRTTEGEISTGVFTHAIGHAGEKMSASRATAHYDQADAVFAQVVVGEDQFGIWYSGVIPEWVSEATVDQVRAIGAVSGDWRAEYAGAPLELRGVVSVPVPGFQIPRLAASAGFQTSLVAPSVVLPPEVVTASANVRLDSDMIAAISRNAIAELRHQEKVEAKLEVARQRVRQHKLATARARVERSA